ncbi:hypothetical protein EPN44_06715 [bacterium]|nr:MAG: hypothetical protein EPN44_06715 [bacterium]
MIVTAAAGAMAAGATGWLGTLAGRALVAEVAPLPDAPPSGRPPVAWLIGGSAVLGALLAPHATVTQLGLGAFIVFALAAAWCSDILRGIVPDICTLGPLAAMLFISLAERQLAPLVSAVIVFVPFALAASFSKGRGMGWGDVKLAALGGAALGAQTALLAFAVASAASFAIHRITRARATHIAFAPYLAAAIGAGLMIGAVR